MRTGADHLCDALLALGVDTCFANPGTSEMHFVAALDRRRDMRCVLGLFEGVVTGAADGYGRMMDRPAATLLHLGPGLANGLANLHNARRAGTPIINIVGEHSTAHLPLDAPLTSDIETLARPMSAFVRRIGSATSIEQDVTDAWDASLANGIATLILPADMAWSERSAAAPLARRSQPPRREVDPDKFKAVVDRLRSGCKAALILSGQALRADALADAERICARTGARLFAQGVNGRIERGRGRAPIEKISFAWEQGRAALAGIDMIVLIGAKEPVTFFGYPTQSGRLAPEGCSVVELGGLGHDLKGILAHLAEAVGPRSAAGLQTSHLAAAEVSLQADAPLTAEMINSVVAAKLPENAIVCDEAITSAGFYELSYNAPVHDYLQITGGAIGIGMPMAAGAAIACPGRKVVSLQADGSGLYTLQGLWTQAREKLDIVTIIFANRGYAILHGEMRKVGVASPGQNARRMLDIEDPEIDWVKLAGGMGVAAERVTTVQRFAEVFDAALRQRGPFVIEASLL
ncbi:acetolactate synthase large subunit [Bradyrhizobium sp. USDA 10063]